MFRFTTKIQTFASAAGEKNTVFHYKHLFHNAQMTLKQYLWYQFLIDFLYKSASYCKWSVE